MDKTPPALSAPLRLVLDLTSRCNLRCAYCCFFSNPEECGRDDLPPERWVDLIDEAGRCGVLKVVLRGGEALLSPAFDAVVAAVVRNRMRFSLLTNGMIFTDAVAARLAATGRCDRVKISLDGPEALHDRLRGNGSHARAVAAIAATKRAGLPLFVTCAVHRLNYSALPEIIRYFTEDLDLPDFSFSGVSSCDAAEYALTETQFREAMHLLGVHEHPRMAHRGMYGGVLRWRRLLRGVPDEPDCRTLRQQLSVLADGTFAPCPALSAAALGRFGEVTILEAWRRLVARTDLRERRAPGAECAQCRFNGVCRGLCAGVVCTEIGNSWRNFCLARQVAAYGEAL
ncbi:MAG: radical SAM protein [Lentisphaeria bacterium]|nr:radical SAM protein [Lentisphaeria bacterium]